MEQKINNPTLAGVVVREEEGKVFQSLSVLPN